MEMTFRWYGHDDPVTLDKIRQIPGVTGIVSAIYDIPVGEVWPMEEIVDLKDYKRFCEDNDIYWISLNQTNSKNTNIPEWCVSIIKEIYKKGLSGK